MNDAKTLKQVCELLNVSRRVIQRYETKELIHTDLKDKYGHLLYDQKTINRMMNIRLYQKMEFKLNEIITFIDKPDKERKEILINRINKLKSDLTIKSNNLKTIENYINNNSSIELKDILKEV